MMVTRFTKLEDIAKYNNVPIYEIRELFKGKVTMKSLYRRLYQWGGNNLKPFEAPFVRAYTYYKSGSGRHSCIRGCSSQAVQEALIYRLDSVVVQRGNNAPRGGKLGEYVIFSYRWLLRAIEDYLNKERCK